MASYYTVSVDGVTGKDAAWYHPEPSERAREIKDRVGFWREVQVLPAPGGAAR